jgi:hypothetical protein
MLPGLLDRHEVPHMVLVAPRAQLAIFLWHLGIFSRRCRWRCWALPLDGCLHGLVDEVAQCLGELQQRHSLLLSRFVSALKRVAIQPLQDVAPPVQDPAAALNELGTGALIAILGERSGGGVEILGDFGGRRQ